MQVALEEVEVCKVQKALLMRDCEDVSGSSRRTAAQFRSNLYDESGSVVL